MLLLSYCKRTSSSTVAVMTPAPLSPLPLEYLIVPLNVISIIVAMLWWLHKELGVTILWQNDSSYLLLWMYCTCVLYVDVLHDQYHCKSHNIMNSWYHYHWYKITSLSCLYTTQNLWYYMFVSWAQYACKGCS